MDRDTKLYWGIGLFCTAMIAMMCWALALDSDMVIGIALLFIFLWILMSFNEVQGILDVKRRKKAPPNSKQDKQ